MFKDCQEWRKTVEGVGIDELYKRIDPFDVSHLVDSLDGGTFRFEWSDQVSRTGSSI